MIAVLLAALSALIWGTADFCGGKAAQKFPALPVAVLSKLASLPVLALFLVLLPGTPTWASLGWSAVAGVAGVSGVIVFYRALAMGAMVVVAPVSAVITALVPLVVGLATERMPGPAALTGAIVAIVAIALVSLVPGGGGVRITARLVVMSLVAGAGFGLFFVFLDVAGDAADGDAALWPIAGAQAAAIGLGSLLLLRNRLRSGSSAGPRPPSPVGAGMSPGAPTGSSGGPTVSPVAVRTAAPTVSPVAVRTAAPTVSPVAVRTAAPTIQPAERLRPGRATVRWIIVAGVLDMTANALYLLAVQGGLLSVVAPLAALYPASTVLLAMLVDRERIGPVQVAGLGLAATALVLVAS